MEIKNALNVISQVCDRAELNGPDHRTKDQAIATITAYVRSHEEQETEKK